MRILLCALLLLENVNVVDVDSGTVIAGRSVVVSDGYIKEIGAQESVRAPAGARVIDGGGRYLMPALWDMHTHPMEPEALSMLVANGVGGTRIMWGLPRHLDWRARIELGELLGPRLLIAGRSSRAYRRRRRPASSTRKVVDW
jgi:cytosine/adenosine deaminase-related metal-dependent hydrolase